MRSAVFAALVSWRLDPWITGALLLTAAVYVRGWLRGRRLIRETDDQSRLAAFLSGLAALALAMESPLDAFDSVLLSVHMTQHLLLMMVAPPLLLAGRPLLPFLRGLPKPFVREGLGPFLAWPAFQHAAGKLVSPPVAWAAFAVSTIGWHLPVTYELALRSPAWHAAQHATFFWTGILFWWPIIQPGPRHSGWPEWTGIPYLLLADIVNTGLSAFFVFSGKILYPTYAAFGIGGLAAQEDQTLAGVIMWVPGSVIYLVPAIWLTMRVVSGGRPRTSQGRPHRSITVRS